MFNWLVYPYIYVPNTDPYGLGATVIPNNPTFFVTHRNIVDWVWVGLRASNDPDGLIAGPPYYMLGAPTAGLLKTDGHIVAPDGVSELPVPDAYSGTSYYFIVGHRNHLAVQSRTPQPFACSTSYDFTTAMSQAYQGTQDPMKQLAGGIYVLIGGDATGNGLVQSSDWFEWLTHNGFLGYYGSDMSLDSSTDSYDSNTFWYPNNGSASQVP